MKKYWKTISVLITISVVFGIFFTSLALATAKYPEFKIQTTTGDESYIEDISIYANVTGDKEPMTAEIMLDGTEYSGNYSYLDSIKGWDESSKIKQLQKDYKTFMRGKKGYLTQFYEDDHVLAYVDMIMNYRTTDNVFWDYAFDIYVLDKATNQNKRFTVKVPQTEYHAYLQIHRVKVSDGKVSIITLNSGSSGNIDGGKNQYRDDINVYHVNLQEEKISQTDVVTEDVTLESNQSLGINVIPENEEQMQSHYLAYTTTVITDGQEEEDVFMTDKHKIYNLETKTHEKINLPEDTVTQLTPELLSGTSLYFSELHKNTLEVIHYDMAEESIKGQQTFEYIKSDLGENHYTLYDGKIYMMTQVKSGEVDTTVTVVDIDTGDVLYEGQVMFIEDDQDKENYDIQMNYLIRY